MTELTQKDNSSTSIDKKLGFLQTALEAAEKRRSGVENKSSILLASNAILLTAISAFGFPDKTEVLLIRDVLILILLSGIGASVLFLIYALASPSFKQRMKILNLSQDEENIFYCGKIAACKDSSEYLAKIQPLTDQRILQQYGQQLYNLSRLVMYRYKWYQRAYIALLVGIAAAVALQLLWIF